MQLFLKYICHLGFKKTNKLNKFKTNKEYLFTVEVQKQINTI